MASSLGDADGDGVPDASDCHPLDPSVWTAPTEALGLGVTGGASPLFTWSAPAGAGGSQTVLYDLIRSGSPSDFSSATCVVSSATVTTASDPEIPGSIFYYLVRAKNGCGGGLGTRSNGTPRTGASCSQPSGSACANAGECAGGGCCGGVCTDLSSDAGSCGVCGASCDDGNPCDQDVCGGLASGCKPHVNVNACATPVARLGVCGVDTDGDGLSDAWESNGYVDENCNGVYDAGSDLVFPRRTPYLFSGVTHAGNGFGHLFPTVTDPTSPIASSTVVVTIVTSGGVGTGRFTYSVNGGVPGSPIPIRPVIDLAGNLRVMLYNTFDAGDTYEFTTAMGPEGPVADPNVPNVYVQYDYMGYDAPGAVCSTDEECVNGGATPNDVCHAGSCTHDHAPGDPLFRKVVDQFAAHGITLYIDPEHHAVPHAQVITWSKPGDGTNGALAECAGYDVIAGDIGNGGAVTFDDVKYRPGSEFALQPGRASVYHYVVFSHHATCLTDDPFGTVGLCRRCPDDRGTPPGRPFAGISGTSELPGNDLIVSMASRWFEANLARTPFDEGGVFMHELGHNLGLHHHGDNANHERAPNYISVMNNRYVFSGISHSSTPGSTLADDSLRELDYSERALGTLTEDHLDEQAGVSPISSGFTSILSFSTFAGANRFGPESGPIDWDGLPALGCASDLDCACGAACPSMSGVCLPSGFCEVRSDLNKNQIINETMVGYRDWDHDAVLGGSCVTGLDCRVNAIRQILHDDSDPSIDIHEPCVQDRCQSLWFAFQGTPWGHEPQQ